MNDFTQTLKNWRRVCQFYYPRWGEWFEDYMTATEAPIETPKSISVWMYQTPIPADTAEKLGVEPT